MESTLDIALLPWYRIDGKQTFHQTSVKEEHGPAAKAGRPHGQRCPAAPRPGRVKGGPATKNRLEELRRQHGIRQEELADALGVSRQTIGSLENGRYNPSILLAFKLARYFGLSIEDIFLYEEEQP